MPLFGVTWNVYSDSGFTTLIDSVQGSIGLGDDWDGVAVSGPLSDDYNFFTRHCSAASGSFLGRDTCATEGYSYSWGLYTPNYRGIIPYATGYYETVFSNGLKVRLAVPEPNYDIRPVNVTVLDENYLVILTANVGFDVTPIFPFGAPLVQFGRYDYGGFGSDTSTCLYKTNDGTFGFGAIYLIRPNYNVPHGVIGPCSETMQTVLTEIFSRVSPDLPKDPYGPGGYSGPGIGPGTFDETTETITIPPPPSFTFADTGFTRKA